MFSGLGEGGLGLGLGFGPDGTQSGSFRSCEDRPGPDGGLVRLQALRVSRLLHPDGGEGGAQPRFAAAGGSWALLLASVVLRWPPSCG